MATLALTDAFVHVAGYDFTGDTNDVMLTGDGEAKDTTTFGSAGWRESVLGLKSSAMAVKGFWQSASVNAVDPQAFDQLGTANQVVTVGDSNAEGGVAYIAQLGKFNYQHGAPIGEVYGFSLDCSGTDGVGVVRGLLAAEKQTVSSTGQVGADCNLGDATGKYVYGALHVFSAGTSITVKVQKDDNDTFSSATDVATFNGGAISAAGGFWLTRTAGDTDTYYRIYVSACTGSFSIAGAIAVQ